MHTNRSSVQKGEIYMAKGDKNGQEEQILVELTAGGN